jgi:hypothetical protein
MPILSFIMPVRDGEAFIEEAVRSVRSQAVRDWELIVVDDHSSDGSALAPASAAGDDPRVRVVANPGRGQVQAINFGYGLVRGEWLKIVDADDLLAADFSDAFGSVSGAEATYHDALLLGGRPDGPRRLRVGPRFAAMSLAESLRRIQVSPPRWSWTLDRRVADRVFPLPADLPSPHEDVFFGLMIKKHARIATSPAALSLPPARRAILRRAVHPRPRRSSAGPAMLDHRSRRPERGRSGCRDAAARLAASRTYFTLLGRDRLAWKDILTAGLSLDEKARVAAIRKTPALAARLSRRRALRKADR